MSRYLLALRLTLWRSEAVHNRRGLANLAPARIATLEAELAALPETPESDTPL